MDIQNLSEAQEILTFWFDDPSIPDSAYGQQRKIWFRKDARFDQHVRDRFLATYQRARQGEFDTWLEQPRAALALTVLLEQCPRNFFRGTARCFEADAQALAAADVAITRQHDLALLPVERMFLYLPFEHSENIEHQQRAVSLFETLVRSAPEFQSTLDYAYRHRDVIGQFGRFPHRNDSLQRQSTAAEILFLKQPGARF